MVFNDLVAVITIHMKVLEFLRPKPWMDRTWM